MLVLASCKTSILHASYCSQAKVGQTMKADVLMVTDYYILVSLRAHAAGNVAYIPAKRVLTSYLQLSSAAIVLFV